jgi:hypothetical protein
VLHAGTLLPVDASLLTNLPKNVAPQIDDITVQPGYRYRRFRTLPVPNRSRRGSRALDPPPPSVRDRDSIGIRWSAQTTMTTSLNTPCTTAAMANRAGCC